MKLAFIVQRYGREILGGSETLARQLAERLARRHDVTVLTTTAQDYITWKNEYKPGEDKLRGVRVHRFPVEGERDIDEFNKFSEEIYKGTPTREQELEWLKRQGPVSPELIEFLKKEHERFDLLIFFTYLYYPTYYGLQVAPGKSVLLPTAHDEPPLRLSIFKEMFQLPSSFLFNTEAEELLVLDRFPVHKKMRETVGMGMELLDQPDPSIFRKRHDVSGRYFLYAGRIDAGKGLEELFRFFTFYKEEHPASGNLQLILIGKLGIKLPADRSIRYIGFVDEAEKLSAMAGAVAVMQPSRMESLSIVTLEAFSVGTPVVASAASQVLVDHCKKANAGFYYRDFEEFEEILGLMLSDKNLGRNMGRNGQRYIKENYGWQKLLAKYELALRASGRPVKESKDPRRRDSQPQPQAPQKASESKESPKERTEAREPEKINGETAAAPQEEAPVPEKPEVTTEQAPPKSSEPVEPVEAVEPVKKDEPAADEAPPPVAALETAEIDLTDRADEPAAKDEDVSEEVVAKEVEEEVDEEIAHLPSFFRSSLPPRANEPIAPRAPEPEGAPVREVAEAKKEPPRPEKSEERAAAKEEGGLPEFFRPKSKPEETAAASGEDAVEPNPEQANDP